MNVPPGRLGAAMKVNAISMAAWMACATVTAGLAGPVRAEPSDVVRVDVSATVPARCGFKQAPAGMTSAAKIDTAQDIPFDFVLDCNAPFAIGVQSANGALAFQGARDDSGFAFEKAYTVGMSLGTSAGAVNAAPCEAAQLTVNAADHCGLYSAVGGEGLSSGDATAIDKAGRLTVSWKARDGSQPRPAAGTFQDTLTIVLGVRS